MTFQVSFTAMVLQRLGDVARLDASGTVEVGGSRLCSTMTDMPDDRMAHSLDDSELWSRTAADELLNQAEYRKTYKALSTREQKRWRHKVSTRLWRSFKQEVALRSGSEFSVQDVCEAVIDDAKLWLSAEWKVR